MLCTRYVGLFLADSEHRTTDFLPFKMSRRFRVTTQHMRRLRETDTSLVRRRLMRIKAAVEPAPKNAPMNERLLLAPAGAGAIPD